MRIVQISDLHIAEKSDADQGPMAANLRNCIGHINELTPQPDLILITGNITADGSVKAAQHAREMLDTLNAPYKLVPGPNDERRTTLEVFDHACANQVGGVVSYVVEGYALRLIGLDSLGHNGTGGHICQKRLNWVNDRLAEKPDQPTLIFMHHPPMKTGLPDADIDGFNNSEYLGQIAAHYTNIKGILCGHVNFACHACWNETVVSCAPSMGMVSTLQGINPGEIIPVAPAYNLHHFTEDGELVSRTVYLS